MSQNTTLKISEHNAATNEVTQRVMTAAEIEAAKSDALASEQMKTSAIAKKQEILNKLGLTADEVTALLS